MLTTAVDLTGLPQPDQCWPGIHTFLSMKVLGAIGGDGMHRQKLSLKLFYLLRECCLSSLFLPKSSALCLA